MADNRIRLICFDICGEKFAFNMEYLVEIVQAQQSEITPFFSPLPILRGKWDYRGSSLYIIDLRDFFGFEERSSKPIFAKTKEGINGTQMSSENEQYQRADFPEESIKEDHSKSMLVVKIHERMFGLLTDAVLQVLPLVDFYEYPNMLSTLPGRYFAGVTIIESELVVLLAIQEFIKEYELDALLSIDD